MGAVVGNYASQLSPEDQIAIIQYSERAQLIQDWTNDREKALNSLASKYRVGIRSSYHDALKLAADKLQAQPNGRRIVVLRNLSVEGTLDPGHMGPRRDAWVSGQLATLGLAD